MSVFFLTKLQKNRPPKKRCGKRQDFFCKAMIADAIPPTDGLREKGGRRRLFFPAMNFRSPGLCRPDNFPYLAAVFQNPITYNHF
jgi:hypothetical protein